MLSKHVCSNNENYTGTGLDMTVNKMNIVIAGGTFKYKGMTLTIEDTSINLEVLNVNRYIGIYLVNNTDNPIVCEEEIDKNIDSVKDLILTIAFFRIPANCNDLGTLSIDYWHYEEVEKK